ncbi:MAG: exopolyphosphatase [Ignavibacteriales bacterium]
MKNYAAIDVGSNSFHLKIVAVENGNLHETVLDKRIVHRLAAKDSSGKTYIPEEKIIGGLKIIKEFAADIAGHRAGYLGFATSAVRESINGADFLARVKKETGITVSIISGHKEAELIYEGAMLFLPDDEREITVIDIGGGSTEIIKGRGTRYLYAESIPVGAVRCSQMFAPEFTYSDQAINSIREYALAQLLQNFPEKSAFISPLVIGTSGTFNSLSMLKPFLSPDESLISYDLILKIELLCSEYKEIKSRLTLSYIEKNKLEILPASITILKAIADYFGFAEFIYSPYAIREGMIRELIRKEESHG